MEIYKIEKPPKSILTSKLIGEILKSDSEKIAEFRIRSYKPRYLYWDKVKYFKLPPKIDKAEFWRLIKALRKNSPHRKSIPIYDENERQYYTWEMLPQYQEFLHKMDMELGGRLESDIGLAEKDRQKFISRGLIEESIASSQLEGANTTRKTAKEMIRAKRQARNRSEQMILNNYEVMLRIEESLKDSKLNDETLLELHEMTVKDTIDVRDIGRFRFDHDNVNVVNESKGLIYHIAPSEEFMLKQIKHFYLFANDELDNKEFIHPIIKATMIHFWIGYLHPFVDGNGRIARALFYWYLLKHNYRAFTYMPLSRVIKKSAGQYRDAYLYSEQDDCDLTYFIDYILHKIIIAEKEFIDYFRRKSRENEELSKKVNRLYQFNDRQIQQLKYFFKNKNAETTASGYAKIHDIGFITASKDLKVLKEKGLLKSRKKGRFVLYSGTPQIDKLLE